MHEGAMRSNVNLAETLRAQENYAKVGICPSA